jgi:uncharacterized protein YlxW (UPF0749 family)
VAAPGPAAGTTPGAAPGPGARPEAGGDRAAAPLPPAARHRLNLIELLTADAVASDYADVRPAATTSSRREQVLVAAIALGVVGFVLALGFSARVLNAPVVDSQRAALGERIQQAQQVQSDLVGEVTALREEVVAAREAELARVRGGAQVAADVAALELATGYVAVTGPGGAVVLTDAPSAQEGGSDEERVLDSDVQRAVNGLWAAGAEGVAVNGQRVSARTAIRSAAGAILVNYRPLRPPYRVEAIGGPGMLETFRAGPDAAYLQGVANQYNIGFTTEQVGAVTLPAATSPLPEQATVIEPDDTDEAAEGAER